jgi:hypothetical protein
MSKQTVEPSLGDDVKINLHEYLRRFDSVVSILVSVLTYIEKIYIYKKKQRLIYLSGP